MKDFIFDSLPTLNSNPAKNGFLAACSSTSADMPGACESFMKITRQFQNNFPQPAAAFGVFSRKLSQITRELFENYPCHVQRDEFTTKFTDNLREFTFREATKPSRRHPFFLRKLSQITRKLAFSLPHRRLSNADASITLRSAQARFFENYSCPTASVRSEKKFTIKFTGNLRTFTFREATKPFGTNRAAKTERNINNYRNAPLAIFRNSSMPVRFPLVAPRGSKNHLNDFCPRRSRIRIIMYISFRKNPEDGLSEMFCCQTENGSSHRLRPWLLSASELARKRQGRRLSAAKPGNCRIIIIMRLWRFSEITILLGVFPMGVARQQKPLE